MPRRVLNVPQAVGICVATNGNFAVIPWNKANKFYLYDHYGNLLKQVKHPAGAGYTLDCAFDHKFLYVADFGGRRIHKYYANGKFVKEFAKGTHFERITACNGRLYASVWRPNVKNIIVFQNDKQIDQFNIKGWPRGIVVEQTGKLATAISGKKVVHFTPKGKTLGLTTYKELGFGDGMALDYVGNVLIADRTPKKSQVLVYSPKGVLLKAIKMCHKCRALDVDVGIDGTILIADYDAGKVYMY